MLAVLATPLGAAACFYIIASPELLAGWACKRCVRGVELVLAFVCALQELLDHPFLHPNRITQPAPAAAAPVLSEEQMKLLVAQVQAAGAAGVTDLDKLTRELMQKLGTATLNSSSSASSSGNSSPRGMTGQQTATRPASALAAAHRQQQRQPQQQTAAGQQRQATGGLSAAAGSSASTSSRSRIPAAAPPGQQQPGWR